MIKQWYEGFKIAWAMLTAIPVFRSFSFDENAGRSVLFYPLVGLLLGLILWAVSIPVFRLFPESLAPYILFAFYTLSYGALHTDGLADTLDALLSYKSPEEMMKILKDPHIGAQGAVYLILFMIVKAVSFAQVSIADFVVIPMLARYGAVLAMFHYPYLSSGTMAKSQHSQLTKNMVIFSSLTLLLIFPFCGMNGLFLLPVAVLWPLFAGHRISKRLTGLNGDSYGFIIETGELLLLLLTVVLYK